MSRVLDPAALVPSAALAALVVLGAAPARSQTVPAASHHDRGDHDEHEGRLHFSHPLVTESPSPDTKLRLDYLWARAQTGTSRVTERGVRVEGEYAFTPYVSLSVTLPYTWRSSAETGNVHAPGNTELSLKAASVHWGEHGVLLGGGLSAGLPTGSDERGIGTSRAVELEPFADVAYRSGALELVGFGHYGTTVRNPAGADAERELAFDGSVLYAVARRAEALVEVESVRSLAGEERATSTSVAPGMKLYPFPIRSLMVGISAPLGLSGEARHTHGVLLSAFYHF